MSSPKYVTGYMGQDVPIYVVMPDGSNELLLSAQDFNATEEAPQADVMAQGFPNVAHLRGIANTTGDGVLTASDVYQINTLGGMASHPSVARISDMKPVDMVRTYIDQDTGKLIMSTYLRRVVIRSWGERTGVGGTPHSYPVAFACDERVMVEGALYPEGGTSSGATITCAHNPLLNRGLLRLSVEINSNFKDITVYEGTYGDANRPTYTVELVSGVITLYGVTNVKYAVVYAIAVPATYDIMDDRNMPSRHLPSGA